MKISRDISLTRSAHLREEIVRNISKLCDRAYICEDGELFYINISKNNKDYIIILTSGERKHSLSIRFYLTKFGFYGQVKEKKGENFHICIGGNMTRYSIEIISKENRRSLPAIFKLFFPIWLSNETEELLFSK